MDRLVHLLFESPLQLLVALVLVEAVVATVWWFRPGRRTSALVIAGLLVGAILLIIQHLVVTDRERIERLLDELALAVDCEDLPTLTAAIDEQYHADGLDKPHLLEQIQTAFAQADIDDVRLLDVRVHVDRDTAEVHLRVHCRVRAPDWPYDYHLSAWDLRLARRAGGWRVLAAHHSSDVGLTARDLLDMATR